MYSFVIEIHAEAEVRFTNESNKFYSYFCSYLVVDLIVSHGHTECRVFIVVSHRKGCLSLL